VVAAESEREQERDKPEKRERDDPVREKQEDRDKDKLVKREVKEIRVRIEKPDRGPALKAPVAEEQREEIKRKLKESLSELKELRAAGMEDAAAGVKMRVQKLEDELARMEKRPVGDKDLKREGKEVRVVVEGRRKAPLKELPSAERRLQHLQVAIDNLHAAGLHEPAERLAEQAGHLKRQLQAGPPAEFRGPDRASADLERLQAEVWELRQAIGELRAKLEEMGRDRR
jgi:hypothetical protein